MCSIFNLIFSLSSFQSSSSLFVIHSLSGVPPYPRLFLVSSFKYFLAQSQVMTCQRPGVCVCMSVCVFHHGLITLCIRTWQSVPLSFGNVWNLSLSHTREAFSSRANSFLDSMTFALMPERTKSLLHSTRLLKYHWQLIEIYTDVSEVTCSISLSIMRFVFINAKQENH